MSYARLEYTTLISKSSLGIIPETCVAIYNALKDNYNLKTFVFTYKNMEAAEVLLDEKLKVHFMQNYSGNFETGVDRILTFLVERKCSKSMNMDLCIQITDEKDPMLLYTAIINESDYKNLKQSQGLLVDFASFPHHLVTLIKQSLGNASQKFALFLKEIDRSNVTLEIVEVNVFRHLCHLQLHLVPADVHTKLSYLSNCITDMKGEIVHREEICKQREANMLHENQKLQSLVNELKKRCDSLKGELEMTTARATQKEEMIISSEKAKMMQFQSDCHRKMFREKKELEDKFQKQISSLQNRLSAATKQLENTTKSKKQLENNLKQCEQRLHTMEKEVQSQERNLEEQVARYKALEEAAHHHYENARKWKMENEKLLEEISLNSNLKADLESRKLRQTELENRLAQFKQKLEETTKDLHKGLKVIETLQNKIKTNRIQVSELESKAKASSELLSMRNTECNGMRKELIEIQTKLSFEQEQSRQLSLELESLQIDRKELEMTVRLKENTIAYLQKQIKEAEQSGDVAKKTPLGQAYLGESNQYSEVPSSTPLSAGTKPHRHNLPYSAVKPVEERVVNDDKENDQEEIFVEKQTVPKRRGLIRTAAVNNQKNKPAIALPKQNLNKKKSTGFANN